MADDRLDIPGHDAELVPPGAPAPTLGTVNLLADDDEDHFSTGSEWDAER